MNFFNTPRRTNPPRFNFNLQQTLADFQHNLSSLLDQALHSALSPPSPSWARISAGAPPRNRFAGPPPPARTAARGEALSEEAIEERLAGVAVYAVTNASEELVLVSGVSTNRSLGLLCFNKDDAEAILDQVSALDPSVQSGAKVVAVALNKVFQLKLNGMAFRFIPDMSEVKHAIQERENAGLSNEDGFWGVPIFQSKSLILKSENKTYRPAFFKKEDLERSLLSAARGQARMNPGFRKGEIQVSVLEDVIKGMKESSSKYNDVVFIPPGLDISTNTSDPSGANDN